MTFEETEKRRAAQLSGPKDRRNVSKALFGLFFLLTIALVYLIAAPYAGVSNEDYATTAGVGALGGLIFLGLRFIAYRKVHGPPASLSLAFLDVLAWIGVVGVLLWSFVFPVLHAFPASTTLFLFYLPQFPIGVYSLTFLWAMLIVLRVVLQPFTKPPSERVYADIETSLKKLTDTVNQVGQQMKGTDQKMDPGLADKVTSIMTEITAVRKELTTIKSTAPASYASPASVSGLRVVAPQGRQVVVPREEVRVVRRVEALGAQPGLQSGIATPESATDNPWLDVLAKRRPKGEKEK
ncbi:MAG: hypothetical protein JRN24_02585 [Nitrososphaerota archaeon]|nr:hypothetical protein [Nitrososphaerota archaeon]